MSEKKTQPCTDNASVGALNQPDRVASMVLGSIETAEGDVATNEQIEQRINALEKASLLGRLHITVEQVRNAVYNRLHPPTEDCPACP